MKKLLIVNNNMHVGGVQKSLYNLLWSLEGQYEITLMLFRAVGEYADRLPSWVKVQECNSLFRLLGVSQKETMGADKLKRGGLAAICRLLGRSTAMKFMLPSQKVLEEEFDCAIAFLHNGSEKHFYGGVQEFVLHKVKAKKKVAFLHCDFRRCGADMPGNHGLIRQFDQIVACSDGCRESFCSVMPEMASRCTTVRNFHRIEEIRTQAQQNPVVYPEHSLNIVMVSRLAHEKGIDRGIEAVACAKEAGVQVLLHIVGGGPMEMELKRKARELDLEETVRFYGEQSNPYRYMVNADLFLLTSYHEAAPMVLEEARCLAVPVLTVRTTSSEEMVEQKGCGWVCQNEQRDLNEMLIRILSKVDWLEHLKEELRSQTMDNGMAAKQFENLIEG